MNLRKKAANRKKFNNKVFLHFFNRKKENRKIIFQLFYYKNRISNFAEIKVKYIFSEGISH